MFNLYEMENTKKYREELLKQITVSTTKLVFNNFLLIEKLSKERNVTVNKFIEKNMDLIQKLDEMKSSIDDVESLVDPLFKEFPQCFNLHIDPNITLEEIYDKLYE